MLGLLVLMVSAASAKEQPAQTVTWPEQGTPVLKFTFGKFKEIGGLGSQHTYVRGHDCAESVEQEHSGRDLHPVPF